MRQFTSAYHVWAARFAAAPTKKPETLNTTDKRVFVPKVVRTSKDARREVRT